MEMVTYSSIQNKSFVNGFAVLNSNLDTLKTVYGPAEANVVGYIDTTDGRLYMSDWSFKRWMDDHVAPNWILPHAATCANPQPTSFSFFDFLKKSPPPLQILRGKSRNTATLFGRSRWRLTAQPSARFRPHSGRFCRTSAIESRFAPRSAQPGRFGCPTSSNCRCLETGALRHPWVARWH